MAAEGTQVPELPGSPPMGGAECPEPAVGVGARSAGDPHPAQTPKWAPSTRGQAAHATSPFPWACAGSICFPLGIHSRAPAHPNCPPGVGQGWGAPGRAPTAVGSGDCSPLGLRVDGKDWSLSPALLTPITPWVPPGWVLPICGRHRVLCDGPRHSSSLPWWGALALGVSPNPLAPAASPGQGPSMDICQAQHPASPAPSV